MLASHQCIFSEPIIVQKPFVSPKSTIFEQDHAVANAINCLNLPSAIIVKSLKPPYDFFSFIQNLVF